MELSVSSETTFFNMKLQLEICPQLRTGSSGEDRGRIDTSCAKLAQLGSLLLPLITVVGYNKKQLLWWRVFARRAIASRRPRGIVLCPSKEARLLACPALLVATALLAGPTMRCHRRPWKLPRYVPQKIMRRMTN